MKKTLILILCLFLCTVSFARKRVKVACVGNSITYGIGVSDPDKESYPARLQQMLGEDKATVAVLESADKWHGVTYKEDKPVVMAAVKKMKEDGIYPKHLWEGK